MLCLEVALVFDAICVWILSNQQTDRKFAIEIWLDVNMRAQINYAYYLYVYIYVYIYIYVFMYIYITYTYT